LEGVNTSAAEKREMAAASAPKWSAVAAALLLAMNCGKATGIISGGYAAPRKVGIDDEPVTRMAPAAWGVPARWRSSGVPTCMVLRGGGEILSDLSLGVFGDMGADFGGMGFPLPTLDDLEAFRKMGESDWQAVDERIREIAGNIDSIPQDRAMKILSGEELLLPGIAPAYESRLVTHFKRLNAAERMEEEVAMQRRREEKQAEAEKANREAQKQQKMHSRKTIAKEMRAAKRLRREEQEKRWATGPRPRPMVSDEYAPIPSKVHPPPSTLHPPPSTLHPPPSTFYCLFCTLHSLSPALYPPSVP